MYAIPVGIMITLLMLFIFPMTILFNAAITTGVIGYIIIFTMMVLLIGTIASFVVGREL